MREVNFSLQDKLDIAVSRVEELTKRLEALKRSVEKCKDEIIGWSSRANTIREIMSQMEGGNSPQQAWRERAPDDSNDKSEGLL